MGKTSEIKTITINRKLLLDFQSSEAYKTLRSNIEFCGGDIRNIAITSCMPNEGKSNVSFNLAIAMAEAGKKVLFIDADMRKSVLRSRYDMSKCTVGLSHFLIGMNPLEEVIYKTNIPRFYMIPTGAIPPNPAELLGLKRFKDAIKSFGTIFDYVIIDTPPLGSVIDSAIVAKECDGVALVVESSAVSRVLAERVLNQLKKADCNILGVILNKVDVGGKAYGKYYGKYYGDYYGEK